MKLKSQSGRSMVEMLGVLAVVGVLSVGGIAGYSYGMDKYRANETVNGIMLMATDIISSAAQNREPDNNVWVTNNPTEYDVSFVKDELNSRYGIQIEKVPSRVCKMIGDALKDIAEVYVGDADYDPNEGEDPCDASEENTMEFYFDDMTTSFGTCKTDTDCSDNETCMDGVCVGEGVVYSVPSCSTNDECKSLMGECVGCRSSWCLSYVLNGQSCQDGAGTCKYGRCILNTTCTSNNDCDMSNNQYCVYSNADECSANPTKCAVNPLTARAITVGETTQIVYISKTDASWWDAKSMCEAKGLEMLSVSDLVEGWSDGKTGTYTRTSFAVALNEVASVGVWTENVGSSDSCSAYDVYLGNGDVDRNGRRYSLNYAVCR